MIDLLAKRHSMMGVSAPSEFSPLDLLPIMWLDASDAGTITSSGGKVSQWDDKSGNGYHVSQASEALKPTTGVNLINFNTQRLENNSFASLLNGASKPHTIFAVHESNSGSTAWQVLVGWTNSTSTAKLLANGFQPVQNRWLTQKRNSGNIFPLFTPWSAAKYIYNYEDTYTVVNHGINGDYSNQTAGSGFELDNDTFNIGGMVRSDGFISPCIDVDIHEVVIFDKNLSSEEKTNMDTYLKAKWSI